MEEPTGTMDCVLTTTFSILMSPGIIHLDFVVRFGPLALSNFEMRYSPSPRMLSGITAGRFQDSQPITLRCD